jgi:hypothetical protein
MGETLVFKNPDELVAQLKRRDWRKDFGAVRSKAPDLGPLGAVFRSVSSSTFRAFRTYKERTPSDVFRGWAARELIGGRFLELLAINSADQYRIWAVELAKGLSKEWHRHLRYKLEIPRSLKLVNLLAKGLCVVTPLWPDAFEEVVWHVEVPLDKYSLRPLACVPPLASLGIRWNKASMGSVEDLAAYGRIQESIRALCRKANVPPLAYDFLAWDVPHGAASKV